MKTKPSINRDNLPISIQKLIEWIQAEKDMNPKKISELVKNAKITAHDLEPWADYDHPIRDSYGRKLIYFQPGKFEMLAMSWNPGDFSAIHDHGPNTQWGSVQVFCPKNHLDHATFMVKDDNITTLKRWYLEPGAILPVNNGLIHQMGNNGNEKYITFHLYGNLNLNPEFSAVTVDARLFELDSGNIQYTDNGVFYALKESLINRVTPGPQADYLTWARNEVALLRRLNKMTEENPENKNWEQYKQSVISKIFDISKWEQIKSDLFENVDINSGKVTNTRFWNIFRTELKEVAKTQCMVNLCEEDILIQDRDNFDTYAQVYDEIIGTPCLNQFMKSYLAFVSTKYGIDYKDSRLLSIGCGTGLVEDYIINSLKMPKENLLGIDISESMIRAASVRINAEIADITKYKSKNKWDITFTGLNVLHYVNPEDFERAIFKAASLTKPGGIFFGDFIVPDHIRWYPNVISTTNVISLREPTLIEINKYSFQTSEIINISRMTGDKLIIMNSGFHKRYLPAINRVYTLFTKAFSGKVDLYDAVTLEPIDNNKDTCSSTRYLVVAKKS